MTLKAVNNASKSAARRRSMAAAMPEVQALCKKHGRATVTSCVARIAQHEKITAEVEKLRRQAAVLERRLLTESQNEGKAASGTGE
jgi:hypothetical protein